jgi:hypothetical protein
LSAVHSSTKCRCITLIQQGWNRERPMVGFGHLLFVVRAYLSRGKGCPMYSTFTGRVIAGPLIAGGAGEWRCRR